MRDTIKFEALLQKQCAFRYNQKRISSAACSGELCDSGYIVWEIIYEVLVACLRHLTVLTTCESRQVQDPACFVAKGCPRFQLLGST